MAKNVLVLKHFEAPKDAGVYHRLVCLTGGNKGEAFVLTGKRIVMGRSEKADIKLTDAKASREHAEITKLNEGWIVTDLGSQNGVVVNENKITQHALKEGDKIIIGTTVFKFARVEVAAKKQAEETDVAPENKKSIVPVLILAAVFAAVYLFDDSSTNTPVVQQTVKDRGFEDITGDYVGSLSKKRAKEDKQNKEKLNTIYQRGLREFREGNFFRAIHEFNLALIISPGDPQAEYYLRKTKENLDASIESFNAQAKREEASLKYKSAAIHYCSIIRLLYSVPDDPRYKSAEKMINQLEVELGMEKGETDCLKKQRTTK